MLIMILSSHHRGCGRASTVRCSCIKRRLARRLRGRILRCTTTSLHSRSRLFVVVPRLYCENSRRPRDIFQYCAAPTQGRRRPDVPARGRLVRTSSTRRTRPSTHRTSRPRPRHSRSRRAGRLFAKRSARRARSATRAAARSLGIRRAAGGVAPAARPRPWTSRRRVDRRCWMESSSGRNPAGRAVRTFSSALFFFDRCNRVRACSPDAAS